MQPSLQDAYLTFTPLITLSVVNGNNHSLAYFLNTTETKVTLKSHNYLLVPVLFSVLVIFSVWLLSSLINHEERFFSGKKLCKLISNNK